MNIAPKVIACLYAKPSGIIRYLQNPRELIFVAPRQYMNPLISICIPTYIQTFLLEENLQSICAQSYKNIEVLVSDDTPDGDDGVKNLIEKYTVQLSIQYVRNVPCLGPPANWNAVLKKAQGEFILLLHHDDQFLNKDSLSLFLQPFLHDAAVDFVFARNVSIDKIAGKKSFSSHFFLKYYKAPSLLITVNTIGPPSNVLLKKTAVEFYDERFKWIVDIENYTRLFKKKKIFFYVDQNLIKTGIHDLQVTNDCLNDPQIRVYENILYAIENMNRSVGFKVFDFYWRLLRNNSIRHIKEIGATGIDERQIPAFVKKIIKVQARFSPSTLKNKIVSRLLMTYTYFTIQ